MHGSQASPSDEQLQLLIHLVRALICGRLEVQGSESLEIYNNLVNAAKKI